LCCNALQIKKYFFYCRNVRFQTESPFAGLATNSVVVTVGDLFDDEESVTYERCIRLTDLKYVKRITMQQAAQVALIQRERDQDCVGETGSGSDKEDLQDFEFKDELFE
jgi:hypothetical protein